MQQRHAYTYCICVPAVFSTALRGKIPKLDLCVRYSLFYRCLFFSKARTALLKSSIFGPLGLFVQRPSIMNTHHRVWPSGDEFLSGSMIAIGTFH